MDSQAQQWSDHLLQVGKLEHSNQGMENVAYFYDPNGIGGRNMAQQFFGQWKESKEGHYEAMVNAAANQVGIGITCNSTTCYGVARFGRSA